MTGAPLHVRAAILDNASVAVPFTDNEALDTTAPSEGDMIVTAGAVLSTLTDISAVAAFPALSTAVPEMR